MILILLIAALSTGITILYWISALKQKKAGINKKDISDKLIELLKE